MSTTIKFNYNDTLKILSIPTNQVNYAQLLETFARIYDLQPSQISSLQLSSKDKIPITNEQQLQHISEIQNFVYCSYFSASENKCETITPKKERLTKDDRIVMKYSKLKIYEKLDIRDPVEIEK